MRILEVAWSIYDSRIEKFSNNHTGGGLMIKNICEYIGRKEEVYILIGGAQLKAMKLGHINVVDTSGPFFIDDYETKADLMLEYFKRVIKELEPDIVNVHGGGDFTRMCIEYCITIGQPYVYTEHLYLKMDNGIKKYEEATKLEKKLYQIPNLNIIAVSKGVKQSIIEDGMQSADNIAVIPNGTDFVPDIKSSDLVDSFDLYGKKVLICSGTVNYRKNQLQIVSAYSKLSNDVKGKIKIIFCGNDLLQGELQKEIKEKGLSDYLMYAGAFSTEEMKEYYSVSDGIIMASLSEGLSISALEMIAYGKPIIMFSDNESALDLCDTNVVEFANTHDDLELAHSIERWYYREWDKEYIRQYSKYYTMERVADDYIDYYKNLLERTQK